MSEPAPFEEEMLQRAEHLARTRGQLRDCGDHDWAWCFEFERIHVRATHPGGRVSVSLQEKDSHVIWSIYHRDEMPSFCCYKPEHYEECVEIMKPLMVLDDLADV